MNRLSKTIYTFVALMVIATGPLVAQQSDYQVQQDFKAEINEISQRINNANTLEDIRDIKGQLEELEEEYSEFEEMLNASLYPQTVDGTLSELRENVRSTETTIESINELNERIESLQADIDGYRNSIAEMDEDSEALRQRLERATANERRLSGLVTQYRENLENRDEFVSEFLENLLNRYQSIDSQTQSEIAEVSERLDDNPVDLLTSIISEYINQADSDTGLEAPDFLRMRAQHAYFKNVWEKIGERLSNSYAPDSPVETEQEITDLLAAWQASIDSNLWGSVNSDFTENGIVLPEFYDKETFNESLNAYVDSAVSTALQQNEEADLQQFEQFNTYWNSTVKGNWGDFLINGKVLDQGEIAAVDVKLGDWARAAEPDSNLMFILFLISLAVILGLIVLLVTKKS